MSTLTIREADVLARQATHLIGTLGHVSEGKSTLIRALTGIKTQRHAKEQERNITIHLGYANCRVYQHGITGELRAVQTRDPAPAGDDWILTAHLSFVDCPGHEAYLATMLGGASVMDTACLIVAANQAHIPQPQTLEHLIAAELMGLTRVAVLQNKLDILEEPAIRENVAKIRSFIADSCAAGGPLLPISAQHGWGVERVLEWITGLPPVERDLNEPARLTCVRSFDVNRPGPWTPGHSKLSGAVIGGTLDQGVVAVGDWLEIRPGILSLTEEGEIQVQPVLTKVRGLRCEGTELPVAVPGSLIAIATDLDPALSIANGMVGQRVGVPGSLPPVAGAIRVRFHRLKRTDDNKWAKHAVGDRLRISSNVMTTEATVTDMDAKRCVTLTLDRPLCLDSGERVAVLRYSPAAGRELLEGMAEVVGVTPWPHQLPAEGAELALVPDRKVVWEPLERPAFQSPSPPTYDELLDAIMQRKEDVANSAASSRLYLPDPVIERVPKQTVWLNWPATMEELDRTNTGVLYAEHFRAWLERDMSTTTHQNAEGAMFVRGFWRVEDLKTVMRRYVAGHKRCPQCSGCNTSLVMQRILKGWCARCKADFPLPS